MDMDHIQILNDSLAGQRDVDEQTHESVAVLADRLEGLKAMGDSFEGIEFSPDVEALAAQQSRLAV